MHPAPPHPPWQCPLCSPDTGRGLWTGRGPAGHSGQGWGWNAATVLTKLGLGETTKGQAVLSRKKLQDQEAESQRTEPRGRSGGQVPTRPWATQLAAWGTLTGERPLARIPALDARPSRAVLAWVGAGEKASSPGVVPGQPGAGVRKQAVPSDHRTPHSHQGPNPLPAESHHHTDTSLLSSLSCLASFFLFLYPF